MNHRGPLDTVRSFSRLSYASKEDYETLQHQWIPFLVVYYPISYARYDTQYLFLCVQFESQPQWKWHTVNHIGF